FDIRRDAYTGTPNTGFGCDGLHFGGERRANTRLPVAVSQAAHDEVAHRDEAFKAVAAPKEFRRIDRQGHLAERQLFRAAFEENFATVGRRQPPANPPIVKVHGDSEPRINHGNPRFFTIGQEECVRVSRRRKVIFPFSRVLRMQKGELRKREHTIGSKPYFLLPSVKLSERRHRIIVELLGEIVTVQDLLGPTAWFAGRQCIDGERAVGFLSTAARHAYRRSAARGDDRNSAYPAHDLCPPNEPAHQILHYFHD